jgi:hypothetical protein
VVVPLHDLQNCKTVTLISFALFFNFFCTVVSRKTVLKFHILYEKMYVPHVRPCPYIFSRNPMDG